MTSSDGTSSLFVAHDLDDLGRTIVRSLMSAAPFSEIHRVASLPISRTDDRTDLANVMLAALGDVMDMDEDADHACVSVSWDGVPKVSCSRSDTDLPWPIATADLTARLEAIGPMHRLVPSLLMPAVRGMLPEADSTEWDDCDGVALGSEMAYQADLDDALVRLRTMAACARARSEACATPGSMVVEGSRTGDRG